jgi:hypothetical protein
MANQVEWQVGQAVKVIDEFNGHNSFVIKGNVERVTKAFVFITTAHGDTEKFRRVDSRQVGYRWPTLMHAIRPVKDDYREQFEGTEPLSLDFTRMEVK